MKIITLINKNGRHEKQYDDTVISIDLSNRQITEMTYIDNMVNLRHLYLSVKDLVLNMR